MTFMKRMHDTEDINIRHYHLNENINMKSKPRS